MPPSPRQLVPQILCALSFCPAFCRCHGTALQWQTPGCRGVTQQTGVTVSLAEQGWPPQPCGEASLISTLTQAVSGSGALWVQPLSTPLQAQPSGDTGKHEFKCLSPFPRLRAWLGFGWKIPTLPSHELWGSSVCRARPQHSDGWGPERGSGDTGMRVWGPTGSAACTGRLRTSGGCRAASRVWLPCFS